MTHQGCLLVIEEGLSESVAAAISTNGYEVHAARTPLEVIQILERHSPGIGYAVLSETLPRAAEVTLLLSEEYPAIQRLLLSA